MASLSAIDMGELASPLAWEQWSQRPRWTNSAITQIHIQDLEQTHPNTYSIYDLLDHRWSYRKGLVLQSHCCMVYRTQGNSQCQEVSAGSSVDAVLKVRGLEPGQQHITQWKESCVHDRQTKRQWRGKDGSAKWFLFSFFFWLCFVYFSFVCLLIEIDTLICIFISFFLLFYLHLISLLSLLGCLWGDTTRVRGKCRGTGRWWDRGTWCEIPKKLI